MPNTPIVLNNTNTSGITAYLYTKTSLTIQYSNGTIYRYDLSNVLTKDKLDYMIKLAKNGKGLNSYLNANPDIKKYGYIDETLSQRSFTKYAK